MTEPTRYDKTGRALVVRLESGGTVVERASNFCSSTLDHAHALLHAAKDLDFKITIEARHLSGEEYDAIRATYHDGAMGELIAMQVAPALFEAAFSAEQPESDGESK